MSRLILLAILLGAAALGGGAGALAARMGADTFGLLLAGGATFLTALLAGLLARSMARGRAAERRAGGQSTMMAGLVRRLQEIESQIAAQGTAIARLDAGSAAVSAVPQPGAVDPTAEEIATLGALVGDLAGALASQEERVSRLETRPQPALAEAAPPPAPAAQVPSTPSDTLAAIQTMLAARPGAPPVLPPRQDDRPSGRHSPAEARIDAYAEPAPNDASLPQGLVEALKAGSVELFLQPMATIPQRKARFYEAVPRLRTGDGQLCEPGVRLEIEAAGLGAAFDALQFAAAAPVCRRVAARGGEAGMACRISADGLAEPGLVDTLLGWAAGTPGFAGAMTLLVDPPMLQGGGSPAAAARRRLTSVGYRFGLDTLDDLRLDWPALAAAGARLAKIPAAVLLEATRHGASVHAGDLRGLLARSDIELAATDADSDALIADLLDLDIRLAQGEAISAARPVRTEVAGEGVPAARLPAARSGTRLAPPAPANASAGARGSNIPAATLGDTVLQDALRKLQGGAPSRDGEQRRDANRAAWRALARPVSSERR